MGVIHSLVTVSLLAVRAGSGRDQAVGQSSTVDVLDVAIGHQNSIRALSSMSIPRVDSLIDSLIISSGCKGETMLWRLIDAGAGGSAAPVAAGAGCVAPMIVKSGGTEPTVASSVGRRLENVPIWRHGREARHSKRPHTSSDSRVMASTAFYLRSAGDTIVGLIVAGSSDALVRVFGLVVPRERAGAATAVVASSSACAGEGPASRRLPRQAHMVPLAESAFHDRCLLSATHTVLSCQGASVDSHLAFTGATDGRVAVWDVTRYGQRFGRFVEGACGSQSFGKDLRDAVQGTPEVSEFCPTGLGACSYLGF